MRRRILTALGVSIIALTALAKVSLADSAGDDYVYPWWEGWFGGPGDISHTFYDLTPPIQNSQWSSTAHVGSDTFTVNVRVCEVTSIQVKPIEADDSEYGDSTTIGVGGYESDVHQASVRITVSPAMAGVLVPIANHAASAIHLAGSLGRFRPALFAMSRLPHDVVHLPFHALPFWCMIQTGVPPLSSARSSEMARKTDVALLLRLTLHSPLIPLGCVR